MSDGGIRRAGGPLRNAIYQVGSNGLAAVIRFVHVIVLARGLGAAEYGVISSLQAFYMMFIFAVGAGLTTFLSRELAIGGGRARSAPAFTLLLEAVALVVCAALFLVIVARDAGGWLALLFAAAIPARGLAMWGRHVFVASEAGQHPLRQVLWFRSGELLAVLAALAIGGGLVAVVVIHLLSWVAEALSSLAIVRRAGLLSGGIGAVRGLLPRGAALLGASLTFAIGEWLRSAPIVLYRYAGEDGAALGRFAFAWNAALLLSVLVVVAMSAAFPVVSRAHVRADGKDIRFLDVVLRGSAVIGAVAAIAGIAFGAGLLGLLLGAEYRQTGPVLAAALATVAPVGMNHALDQRLYLDGRTGRLFAVNMATLALLVPAFVLVLRLAGPTAAVLALFAVLTAAAGAKLVLVARRHGTVPLRAALRGLACGGLAVGAAVLVQPFGAVATLAAGGFALAVAGAALGLVSGREWRGLRRRLGRG